MSQQELDAVIQLLQDNPFPEDLNETRAMFDGMGAPLPEGAKVEEIKVGSLLCYRVTPAGADTNRIIEYYHGGGYIFGSFKSHGGMATEIAAAANCQLFFVEFRRAPENPHPAPLEDAVAGYRWLLDNGYKSENIAFVGDSAGGGLCVAAAIAVRDAGLPLPAALAPISPWADLACAGPSYTDRASIDPFINPDMIKGMSAVALGETDAKTPTISPVYADLKGLPPMLIQVGEREILFSDSETLAKKVADAGGQAKLDEWKGMIHVWHLFYPMLSEARDAIGQIGSYVAKETGAQRVAAQ